MPTSPSRVYAESVQASAPQIDIAAANAPPSGYTAADPMPLASPITQGFKRKADGSFKANGLGLDSPVARVPAHKRNKSMDTHSGTRIGEVRASSPP